MNPNDNQQNPIDYLDQIASKPTTSNWISSKKPLFIALIVMFALFIFISFSALMTGNTQTNVRLAAKLIDTSTITKNATKNIKSTKLQALNSNLSIYLSNTIRDIEPILLTEGVKIKGIDKKIISAEADLKLVAILEDARLNATYDRTYSREMAYKMNTILTLMNKLSKSNKSKTAKEFFNNSIKNLTPIQKELADFNETNI